jgi:enoyl-CoA hydratase/carnithine racemase
MADRHFQTATGGNMPTYPDILYDVKDRVATITLNRPDRLNAYTPQMANSLRLAMADAAKDTNVRAIVLTGAGRGFCAGADMQVLTGVIGGNRTEAEAKDDPAFASKYGPSLDKDFGDMKRFA